MIILENMDMCYGCGACKSVCPKGAISMVARADGFLYPEINDSCIECGACQRVCPALNPKYENDKKPSVWAAMAEDGIRELSASGGVFSVLASYVLGLGGCVFGAAFDEGFRSVSHAMAETEEELAPLRRSKYMQSKMGDTYEKVKDALTKDRYVLFTGTPCQCAALKSYLKRPHEKLFITPLYLKLTSVGLFPPPISSRKAPKASSEGVPWQIRSIIKSFSWGRFR